MDIFIKIEKAQLSFLLCDLRILKLSMDLDSNSIGLHRFTLLPDWLAVLNDGFIYGFIYLNGRKHNFSFLLCGQVDFLKILKLAIKSILNDGSIHKNEESKSTIIPSCSQVIVQWLFNW